jgi:hypothetical protein
MVEAYQAINYREDVAETCTEARRFYPQDGEVRRLCGAAPVAGADSTARAVPAVPAVANDSVGAPDAPGDALPGY